MSIPGIGHKISPALAAILMAQAVLILFCLKVFVFADSGETSATQTASLETPLERPESAAPGIEENSTAAKAGQPAPRFSVQGPDGPVTLADYRGEPLVLEFIATWCSHCRASAPAFAKVLSGSGMQYLIVGAAREDLETVREWHQGLLSEPMPGQYAVDPDQEAVREYGVSGTPTTFFISSNGTIESVVIGEISEGDLRDYVAALN